MASEEAKLCQSIPRVILDLFLYFLGLTIVMLMVFDKLTVFSPFPRGFFCDDQDLMYPLREETVGTAAILGLALFVAPLVILVVEIMYFCLIKEHCSYSKTCGSQLLSSLYKNIGMYLIGGNFTLAVVEVCKVCVGRLRPYFFEICKPNWDELNCTNNFITEYNCTSNDEEELINARKSFPSGHAAAACYEAFFLVVYLHIRWHSNTYWARVLCPIAQTVIVSGAIYISVSRVQDYRHHATDVIGGAIFGIGGSLVTVMFHSDLPKLYLRDRERRQLNSVSPEKLNKRQGYDNMGLPIDNIEGGYVNKGFYNDNMLEEKRNHLNKTDEIEDKPNGNKEYVLDMNGQTSKTPTSIQTPENITQNVPQDYTDLDAHGTSDFGVQKPDHHINAESHVIISEGSDSTRKRHIDLQEKERTDTDSNKSYVTKISVISSEKL